MVAIKPHSITIAPVGQPVTGAGVMENPHPGSASSAIACLVAPMEPSEAYHRFGVVLIDPRKIYLEVADALASSSPNALITFNGVQFWQKGDAEVHQNGDSADCAVVYCSRNQFPY